MDKTAIQAGPPPAPLPVALLAPQARQDPVPLQALKTLASLRITVVLFVLSIILVFCGTLAQVDSGILTVVNKYFRSALVWIPFQIFFSRKVSVSGGFPFPGGWLLGGLLLVNLLAAHAVRFQINWKRSGILLIHAGLIVIMVGELVTGLMAEERRMTIEIGGTSNYVEDYHLSELVFVDSSDPKNDNVVAVPGALLRQGKIIRHPQLPVDIEPVHYMINSAWKKAPPDFKNPATHGLGLGFAAFEQPEVSGTAKEQRVDAPSAYLSFKDKETGISLGTYLVGWFQPHPETLKVKGKTYLVSLRPKRSYRPYFLHLSDFEHKDYPDTKIPRTYISRVKLMDPERKEERDVVISMNRPLRYRGETFYQADVLGKDEGTVLQVVHNPGAELPYISCIMVAVGMLIHFGLHLMNFLKLRVLQ